jgi:hypothetical protein
VFCPIAFAAHPQIGQNIGLPLDNRGCNIYQPDLWIRRESLWVATPVPVGQKVARGMGDGSSTSEVMQFCLQCHTGQRERGRERGIPRGDQHAGNMLSPRGPLAVNCRIFLLRGFFGRYRGNPGGNRVNIALCIPTGRGICSLCGCLFVSRSPDRLGSWLISKFLCAG